MKNQNNARDWACDAENRHFGLGGPSEISGQQWEGYDDDEESDPDFWDDPPLAVNLGDEEARRIWESMGDEALRRTYSDPADRALIAKIMGRDPFADPAVTLTEKGQAIVVGQQAAEALAHCVTKTQRELLVDAVRMSLAFPESKYIIDPGRMGMRRRRAFEKLVQRGLLETAPYCDSFTKLVQTLTPSGLALAVTFYLYDIAKANAEAYRA